MSKFLQAGPCYPILKESSLDKEIFKNYRPVSNLNFISKILERVMAVQLQTHIDEAGLMNAFQSGKTHSVKVGSTLSHPAALQYGLPQGSVLCSVLFSLYTNRISSIIHSHSSINHHFCADDTPLYITLSPTNFSHSIQKLKNCLNVIQNFMFTNKLKLNPEKTEFILIGSKNNSKQLLPHFLINILGNQVSPAQSVKNLRVVFDSNFSFSDHVPQIIKSTRVHA